MHRAAVCCWSAWLAMMGASAGAAVSTAGPGTAGCHTALQALEAVQGRAAAARRASAPLAPEQRDELQRLRQHAAVLCLGGRGEPASPRRPAPAPINLSPVAAPQPPVPAAVPVVPAPGVAIPLPRPPVSLGSCDLHGCWSSEGRYLPRVAPGVLGAPSGHCHVQAGLLACPP